MKNVRFLPVLILLFFLAGCFPQKPSQPTSQQDSSLIGEWHLDGNVVDSSGNHNDGKLVNASYGQGILNQSAVLSGNGSYIEIPDSPSLADGAASQLHALTVSVWINLKNLPAGNIAPLVKEHVFRFVISSDGTGHFVVATADNSWYSPGTMVNLNTKLWPGDWHQLVATYNGVQLRAYVDGMLKGVSTPKISGVIAAHAKPMGRTTTAINNPLRFGYKSSANIDYMDGRIDEVRLYNRALTSAEIKQLYQSYDPSVPTSEPQATSTPFVLPAPSPTPSALNQGLPFQDNFSDATSGWEVAGDAGYRNGAYVITASDPQVFIWALAHKAPLSNIHLQVTAKLTSAAADASFGVLCNYQDDGNFYFLGMGADGRYAIIKFQHGQPVYLSSSKVEWLASDKIPKAASSYQVGAACKAGALSLEVNGQVIASAQDSTLTQGDVGLAVMANQYAPAEVTFSDFVLQ